MQNATQNTELGQDQIIATNLHQTSLLDMISATDNISKLIMLVLIAMSLISWAVVVIKFLYYREFKKCFNNFNSLFWSGLDLEQIRQEVIRSRYSGAATVFIAAMNEYKSLDNRAVYRDPLMKLSLKQRIEQVTSIARDQETQELNQYLGILSSIGSSATFVGLLGTVWGIMCSFRAIAASQNTSLAVVAPGIADALLATAIALCSAIPAVIFANYFSIKSNALYCLFDDFTRQLNSIMSKIIDEEEF
ncbi:Tol-Pal system protein TolQ [Rickettsiales endosymbiont of Paramecium tredecaurelia]|uniref:MotA/TolQ/ExbB proton channel family protein n=1 Tax=Candidatus Sarmatiella mevalonica TaxID=2770581 RepID=UPI00192282EA|nr:MotA/TolQ/ExbB proton channel family protein [Candidatus Sarmatiella mevalonica]MBL3284813.1 Tol-Pal system protein TolQ [Candidatus Sarmatiella mevalonica]